jgi:hypothetical protein
MKSRRVGDWNHPPEKGLAVHRCQWNLKTRVLQDSNLSDPVAAFMDSRSQVMQPGSTRWAGHVLVVPLGPRTGPFPSSLMRHCRPLAPRSRCSAACASRGKPAVSVTTELGRITQLSIGPKVMSAVAHHVNCELVGRGQKKRGCQRRRCQDSAKNTDSATLTCPWNFCSQMTRRCSLVSEDSGPIFSIPKSRKGKAPGASRHDGTPRNGTGLLSCRHRSSS